MWNDFNAAAKQEKVRPHSTYPGMWPYRFVERQKVSGQGEQMCQ